MSSVSNVRTSSKSTKKRSKKIRENETQTSKTILQLAQLELQEQGLHKKELPELKPNEEVFYSSLDLQNQEEKKSSLSLTKLYLQKHTDPKPSVSNFHLAPKEYGSAPNVEEAFKTPLWSKYAIREIRVKSVNTNESFQENKLGGSMPSVPDSLDMKQVQKKKPGSPKKQYRSDSSTAEEDTVVICNSDTEEVNYDSNESIKTKDHFHILINNVKSEDWNVSLKAMTELSEKAKIFDVHRIYSHMAEINQKLIEFLRSPRSQVCRSACQIAGKFFETVKDTRRPEFDDIVELLLMRTADSNKFIRKDANLALDSLIMNVSYVHTIRAISQKGPLHKNDLVRITSARLFVCIVGIAGVPIVLSHNSNESTRTRIYENMILFIKDRNSKTREYGIRLYRLLHDHQNFDMYLRKSIDKARITEIRKIMKK